MARTSPQPAILGPPTAKSASTHDLASNLSLLLQAAPVSHCANIAKKRRHLPEIMARSNASPGRSQHISTIFGDASLSLQKPSTPRSQISSEIRAARSSFSAFKPSNSNHHKGDGLDSTCKTRERNAAEDTVEHDLAKPSLRERSATPKQRNTLPSPSSSTRQKNGPSDSPNNLGGATDPIHHPIIQSWLHSTQPETNTKPPTTPKHVVYYPRLEESGSPPSPKLEHEANTNIKPGRVTRNSSSLPKSPVKVSNPFSAVTTPANTRAVQFVHPMTPRGHLLLPPKRKGPSTTIGSEGEEAKLEKKDNDFTIGESRGEDASAGLGSHVEQHWKGRRGKGRKQ